MLPKEEAERADIDPSRHAYIDRPDLGVEGYPVLPEAIHEMHCINMLRRNLYYNIEHTRANCHSTNCEPPELESWRIQHVGTYSGYLICNFYITNPETFKETKHAYADHCLEVLRNRVACTADLGVGKNPSSAFILLSRLLSLRRYLFPMHLNDTTLNHETSHLLNRTH